MKKIPGDHRLRLLRGLLHRGIPHETTMKNRSVNTILRSNTDGNGFAFQAPSNKTSRGGAFHQNSREAKRRNGR